MAKGDGSITPVKDKDGNVIKNRWRVCVCNGRDPITKKQKRAVRIVDGTKAEARRVRDKLVRDRDCGLKVEESTITFREFAARWARNKRSEGELSARTLHNYDAQVEYLGKFIGGVRLHDIDARMVEDLYTAIRADKEKMLGHPVSGTTMLRIHAVLKQILRKAVDYDLILRNPCDKVKAPRKANPKRRALTAEDAARLLYKVDQAEDVAYVGFREKEQRQIDWKADEGRGAIRGMSAISQLMAVRIGLATGMRRGEVFGLVWDDIDLKRGIVSVRRSLTVYGDTKEPKTSAGTRSIAIDAETAKHLLRLRSLQTEVLKKLRKIDEAAKQPAPDQPVLCSDTGGWYDVRNFSRWWALWRVDQGFSDLKFHELRHTQATQLLANGVDVKTVQARMGHSSASLTLNWYAHAIPENDRKAADLLGSLFGQQPAEGSEAAEKPRIIHLRTA